MSDNNNQNSISEIKGHIIELSDDTFITEVLDAGEPVLVDFWATWCGPCRMMAPIFEKTAPEYEGKVKFTKLDVDENPGVSSALRVQSIPTLMLFNGRTVLNVGVGAMRQPDLKAWIDDGLSRVEEAESARA